MNKLPTSVRWFSLKSICLLLAVLAAVSASREIDAQGAPSSTSIPSIALQRFHQRQAMSDAYRSGALPPAAPLPEGDTDNQAAKLAMAVSTGDGHSVSALVTALYAAGFVIRRPDGQIDGASRPAHGLVIDAWQVAAMAKLYSDGYSVPLDRLGAAFAKNVPEFKDLPLATMLADGIRTDSQLTEDPQLRFWAQFIIDLGRNSENPYDLLTSETPAAVDLDAIQMQLILMHFANDLHKLETVSRPTTVGSIAPQGPRFVNASYRQPPADLPCSTSDPENLILDTTATATTNAFGPLAEYLGKHGFGGIGSYGKGVGRAGLVLTVLKFISTYAALDVTISMEGSSLVRTKNKTPGGRRKLTATVRSNTGNWQMLNCIRPALNLAGLDFSLPGDGPIANVKVTWNLLEGGGPSGLAAAYDTATHLGDLLAGKDHDTGSIVFLDTADGKHATEYVTVTNDAGQSIISAVGSPQTEDLAAKGATGVVKHATVSVSVQAKPTKLKNATAGASTVGDFAGGIITALLGDEVGGGVSVGAEMALRSQWYSSEPFPFQVDDWEACTGGWSGTVTVERKFAQAETTAGDNPMGPWTKTVDSTVTEKTTCALVTTGNPERSVGTCRMAETYQEVHGERNKGNTLCDMKPGSTEKAVAAIEVYAEQSQRGGGSGQIGAVVMTRDGEVTISVLPIEFNTVIRNSQKVTSGCGPVEWGPFYGNFDNQTLTPRPLGGVAFAFKTNESKGSRTETPSEGTIVTYTWDLKPCGAK